MTCKKNGTPTKQDIVFDPDIIFRVSQNDTFEVIIDDSSIVTFNFKQASFAPQAKSKSRARKCGRVMVYADYDYYKTAYLGTAIAESDFPRLALRASSFLDYYTQGRAGENPSLDALKMDC